MGGNSGYFCLSLIDVGMIAKATIYDAAPGALSAGRIMARHMGIENKITFVEKSIDLDFLRSLPKVDTILCLNLLHHAGVKFDVAKIERDGWEKYAVEWFSEMGSKCRLAIVGLGFEEEKPPHWAVLNAHRAAYVANIAERARWSTLYDANVSDIQLLGVEGANGRYTKGGQVLEPKRKKLTFKKIIRKIRRLRKQQSSSGNKAASSKVGEYHLYIFEGVGL